MKTFNWLNIISRWVLKASKSFTPEFKLWKGHSELFSSASHQRLSLLLQWCFSVQQMKTDKVSKTLCHPLQQNYASTDRQFLHVDSHLPWDRKTHLKLLKMNVRSNHFLWTERDNQRHSCDLDDDPVLKSITVEKINTITYPNREIRF